MDVTDLKSGNFLIRRNGHGATLIGTRDLHNDRDIELMVQSSTVGQDIFPWGAYGKKSSGDIGVWNDKNAPIVWTLYDVNMRDQEAFDKDIIAVFDGSSPNSKLLWKADTDKFRKGKK